MPGGIQAVADHGALTALLGQRRFDALLSEQLGEYRFDGDLQTGRISFASAADPGRRLDTRAQLVASIAPGPRSLLWGWAHPQAVDRSAAETLRALGEQHRLAELTASEVPLPTPAQGEELGAYVAQLAHVVGAAAVEATGRMPYYSVPMGGGSRMVFLLDGVPLPPADLARDGAGMTSALMEAATTDPRASLLGYARHSGFGVRADPEGGTDEIVDGRGSQITARWESGRLAGLSMHLVPSG